MKGGTVLLLAGLGYFFLTRWNYNAGSFDPSAPGLDSPDGFIPQYLSAAGLEFIKSQEGFSPVPYPDAGKMAIGYGHQILPGENFTTVTESQASDILANDVAWAEQGVRDNVTVPINQNQFDALVSFVFNEGVPHFQGSTLLTLLNSGDYAGAADEFARWVYAGGSVSTDLEQRRAQEEAIFNS